MIISHESIASRIANIKEIDKLRRNVKTALRERLEAGAIAEFLISDDQRKEWYPSLDSEAYKMIVLQECALFAKNDHKAVYAILKKMMDDSQYPHVTLRDIINLSSGLKTN